MKFLIPLLALASLTNLSAADKLAVASLSTVLSDIAENVGGDKIAITNIVKPGVDPHDFTPSPSDVKAISNATIVLASGLGFEVYLDKLRESVGTKPTFVVAGEALKPIYGFSEGGDDHAGHDHGDPKDTPDPHWFHSIRNAELVTTQIRDAFIKADPANKVTYSANAKTYQAKLAELRKWVNLQLATLPKDKRVLVTSHDALGYFARDYGFTVLPIVGFSTTEQPSSKRVAELIQEIKAAGVKAIFAENIENPKVLLEITKETGATIGGTLYADGLGDKEANTFDSMVRHNVTTIVGALK